MKRYLCYAIAVACAPAVIFALGSCSRERSPKRAAPKYYADSTIAKTRKLTRGGYGLLKKNDLAGALAKFDSTGALIPSGMYREYHTACAHARMGDRDKAFSWLARAVGKGLDHADALEGDPDFESLQDDPRMKDLISRARRNFEKGTAHLAAGFPAFAQAPDTFATLESLRRWKSEQEARLDKYRDFWTHSQRLAERFELAGRYLEYLRVIKGDNPAFDYGLERIRAAMNLQSIYMPGWGAVSDLVRREVDSYSEISPGASGADEAYYNAGMAISMKCTVDDPRRAMAFGQAQEYLSKVAEGSGFFGAAQAVILVNRFWLPGAAQGELGPAFRGILERFPEDARVHDILSARLENGAAAILWPIELDVADIDGKIVSLADYRGKVLMIDFWATWCSPCRREIPHLVEAFTKYHLRGFEIVSISLDYPRMVTKEAYRDSVAAHGMVWRHVYDCRGWDTELARRYLLGSIPAPFLVGRDGSLVAWGAELRGKKLAANIERALGAGN